MPQRLLFVVPPRGNVGCPETKKGGALSRVSPEGEQGRSIGGKNAGSNSVRRKLK